MLKRQTTSHILMVRPANFGYNEETAQNNAFQTKDESVSQNIIRDKAQAEFDKFVEALRQRSVNVIVAHDSPIPVKTDAVFPNNWVTTHFGGTMILYPMYAKVRRLERDENIVQLIENQFVVNKKIMIIIYPVIDRPMIATIVNLHVISNTPNTCMCMSRTQ